MAHAGLDWVASNAKKPAVASLSLGVPSGQWSRSLETAVQHVIDAGIPVVVAAGNSAVDACKVAPARGTGTFERLRQPCTGKQLGKLCCTTCAYFKAAMAES